MNQWPQTQQSIVDGLHQALRSLPGVEVRDGASASASPHADRHDDGVLVVAIDGREFSLVLEVKKAVYPRDVRQVLAQMKSESVPAENRLALLVAESISPGAKELLREEGIGYWDSGGSLFLIATGIYILIERPAPKSLKRTMRTLFSGRRAQAILAILSARGKWVGVAEIARVSGVSRPTVSQVMTELERQGLMDSRGAGPAKERRVSSPGELLDTWVDELPTLGKANARRFFVPGVKADRLAQRVGRQLEASGVTYALTGQAAAQRYAPFLSNVSVVTLRVLGSHAVDEVIGDLGGQEVAEGANLEVFAAESEDEFNFREYVDDVWLCSPIRTYLDLLRSKGRSQELADHLRRERIGF